MIRVAVLVALLAVSACAITTVQCVGTTTCGTTSTLDAMTSVPNPQFNFSAIPSI